MKNSWHALEGPEVLQRLGVDPADGLDAGEVARRLAQHGPNRLPEPPRRPAWQRFALQFHNPLIYVLLAAGLATLLLGSLVDAGVILGVVLINALIGHIQEGKAEQALAAVRRMLAARATVQRGGERHQIDAGELVPGDIVWLEPGDRVPADLRLLQGRNLRTVESALTGESAAVDKDTGAAAEGAPLGDRHGMAFSGTLVAYGSGSGVVVATGGATEIGHIGQLVSGVQTLATPLTRRLDRFARQITAFILGVSVLTMAWGHFVAGMALFDLFLAVVGLAVAAIPEGMPAVVTIVLAIGTRVMARKKAIVRRLPAVESLGSVTVICSDKTGTLTRNEMTAVRVVLPGRELRVTGTGYVPEGGFHLADGSVLHPGDEPALMALLHCALLCNDARIHREDDKGWVLTGDPTEGALTTLAHKADLDAATAAQAFPRLDAIPFESERQIMVTLHHDHAGHHELLLKGAPERVLALCTGEAGGRPLDCARWTAAVERAGGAGERVLALARCDWPTGRTEVDLADLTPRFEMLGLVGIIDPPREEAVAAVAECREAGIRVKMITGDHAVTAAAIGRQLGLQADRALTGDAVAALDDAALRRAAQDTDVFARASPEHKLRLIAALQAEGHQVAMTGDGVNDAPALKAADVGVAMGGKGTDAAREASDLVLTDDNFATIARAVREGRVVYDNIKKSLMHMLPTNGGEAGVILLAIFAGLPLPVTAGQILWVNTVTSVTLALSLAFEPAEPGVMRHPPRPPQESIITRALGGRILFVIGLMIAATFWVFHWELARGTALETARTAAVNTIVMCELFYLFNVRHFTRHAWRSETLTGNPVALGVAALLVGLQLLFTYAPPLQRLFHTTPLHASSWAMILAMGAGVFVLVEAEKALLRRRGVRRI
ncbi:HAD-IC family P-type ATPase [Hydrogenophaga sp. H7]|uniref:cation-translocating P-type ATPase n=1 Tax=Hydrogenophaga sp. H7 TaxID=1882399 RepID=UPI0009A44F25|nr:HAD-IC family P-type ATPase [Hydrogenophaga sp. H7]OPF62845.1 carbonate dehydratase [Hydrogenophaga sp. H7]